MLTLAQILNTTQNGQELLDMAKTLGFQNVRLYHSFSGNTLCLVVDFDLEKERSAIDNRNVLLLEIKIAKLLNCKTIVLQNHLISSEDRADISKGSVLLPIKVPSQLISIFGDPTQFKINTITEDKRYAHDLSKLEGIYANEIAALNNNLNADTIPPSAEMISFSSKSNSHVAKKRKVGEANFTLKPSPFGAKDP